jgi:DNA ligase 1
MTGSLRPPIRATSGVAGVVFRRPHGPGMLLEQVAITSERVSATQSRRDKIGLLASCLAQLVPSEVAAGVAFLAGELRQGRIGIGYAAVRALGAAPAAAPSIMLSESDAVFERLSGLKGAGSSALRERELGALFQRATAREQDFLRRLLLGELRQGALDGLMADAIAKAYAVDASAVRRAVMLSADLGHVALAARERGAAGLVDFALQLFRPVQPMLAQTAVDVADALARSSPCALEFKLDGARVQVHRQEDQVRIFTRAQNEVTQSVPELVEAALRLPARAFVLDGEAIVLGADARPFPFQLTMRRFGRRLEVETLRRELPLSCFFFDILHLDGDDLMGLPASQRTERLASLLAAPLGSLRAPTGEGSVAQAVPRVIVHEAAEGEAFVERALQAGHEGVVAKALNAPYEAGRRGGSWLKIKRSHTLDLVVLAAEWGSGRRRGWLSNLHLGARAPDGSFVMLGKTFKGMTDDMLHWQTTHLLTLETAREGAVVRVRPELVVEIAFDGIQHSPHYPGGVALRFARVKAYRPDKRPQDADTLESVRALMSPAL